MTLRQPKILVVDGQRATLAAMHALLGQRRCQVVLAQSGNEALAACLRNDFALVFLSVELPDMDSFEVAELLKGEASTRHLPIILVATARGDTAQRLRGYELGAIDYLEKPVDDIVILSKVSIFIDLYVSKQQLTLELARSESMRAAVRENETRYREVLDSAPIPIMLHAEDGQVILVNKHWQKVTGYAHDEATRVEDWIVRGFGTKGSAIRTRVSQLYNIKDVLYGGEYQLRSASGAELEWAFRSAPLAALPDGRRLVVSMAVDVTAHRSTLRAAAEAKRMAEAADRAKGEFLANMSHEIRTPLHVIIGLAQLLRRDLTEPGQQGRLDQLCATSDHLLMLINDVLDLSKIEANRLAVEHNDFDLDALVGKVVRMVDERANGKGLTLQTAIAPQLRGMALNGDALRLAQVLINLCDNAIKSTDQGTVRLGLEWLGEDADAVRLHFLVADSGIGIAPADQARLFHAFVQGDGSPTRKRGGTGLGLAISQHLVALMGGTIRVVSEPGAGSTFSFELALPRATTVVSEAVPSAGVAVAADFCGRSILLAEDHPLSQEILFEMLADLGFEVDVASDGAEALACAQARSFDLILLDMQMPKMDGLQATRAIRALPAHRDTPIIALTANVFAEDRQRCLEAGMNGYISKPVTPTSLAAILCQWLPQQALPAAEAPVCAVGDNELSRALANIPGFNMGAGRSPDQLEDDATLLIRFMQLHGQDMRRLRAHLTVGERDAAQVVAHQLVGIAGLAGARRDSALASQIDQVLRVDQDASMLIDLAVLCEAELAGLTEAIARLLAPATELGAI